MVLSGDKPYCSDTFISANRIQMDAGSQDVGMSPQSHQQLRIGAKQSVLGKLFKKAFDVDPFGGGAKIINATDNEPVC